MCPESLSTCSKPIVIDFFEVYSNAIYFLVDIVLWF